MFVRTCVQPRGDNLERLSMVVIAGVASTASDSNDRRNMAHWRLVEYYLVEYHT